VTRVLVTGGRGLLGSAVVAELVNRGHDVVSFQRTPAGHRAPAVEVLGDICDGRAVREALAGCTAVVHLAATVSMVGGWAQFERVNVDGTRQVLAAARAAGVRQFVQVSSPSVAHAGRSLVGVGAEPADPSAARGHYARSKAMAELLVLAADSVDLRTVAIRPHLVWGSGDTQLIGRIVDRARQGRLAMVGSGAALIDTIYVDNAAAAIAQALERCDLPDVHGRAFVVTNGEPRAVGEILARIATAAGAVPTQRHIPYAVARSAGAALERVWAIAGREDEPIMTAFVAEQLATAHWFDQRATRAALDWRPAVSLAEGFDRLARSLA
jgi:nucleoside-diphosphate-sugar epimerase